MLTQTKEIVDELEDTNSCCSHSVNHSAVDNCLATSSIGLHRLWPSTATLIVCSNSLHGLAKNCLPKNIILLEYGFQVNIFLAFVKFLA